MRVDSYPPLPSLESPWRPIVAYPVVDYIVATHEEKMNTCIKNLTSSKISC